MKYSFTLAALVASVSAGTASIKSYCNFPIYMWAVDENRNPQSPTTLNYGESYSEAYQVLSSGGVSLKLSKDPTMGASTITQFEYTYQPGVMIWYDGSNVNCQGPNCPFYSNGVYMATSSSSCPTRSCPPNQQCDGFYNLFNDDWNSLGCTPSADIFMYLCSTDGSAPASGSSPSAVQSAVSSVVSPDPSAIPTPAHTPAAAAVQQNDVSVPTTISIVASPSPSAAVPVFQMEAIHMPVSPKMHRRALLTPHLHMRRHAHAHRS